MVYFFRFEYWWVLLGLIPVIFVVMIMRRLWYRQILYRYSLGASLKAAHKESHHQSQNIFYGVRFLTLFVLALLIAKPQLVDSHSNLIVEGIDIMLVLDVSGSMQFQDYSDDSRSRFEVAKEEAIRFINKRKNDALGLVLFGKDAVSRCPLTHDKKIMQEMVSSLKLGDIDPDGTMLATGMITAINRLKHSDAKSKVMILLTDGEPSEGDMDPVAACKIAKKFNIKVYTVGIGSSKEEVFMHPLYGFVAKPKVNEALLQKIARETGGTSFMAQNAKDMREIYNTIDSLERTKHETPLYSKYDDLYVPIALVLLVVNIIQVGLSSFRWFSI